MAMFRAAAEGDGAANNPFSQYYQQITHQQNMLQDAVRTGTYQRAIVGNSADFRGKVVLDVGTGTGILAFFAAQAGARKVYAVEASDMADVARKLVESNGMQAVIEVVKGKLEDITLPEKVDIIVSEPIGFLLVHERMLETYIVARDKFLKPGGAMYPTAGTIVVTPITCDALYQEQLAKAAFWSTADFYGVNVSSLWEQAVREHFSQAIVGYMHRNMMISQDVATHTVDFATVTDKGLTAFEVPFRFTVSVTAIMHGIGAWFDLSFKGSQDHVVLSTSPDCPGTHWYQCRLMFSQPLAVNATQVVCGVLKFQANDKFSYCIDMEAELEGSGIKTTQHINLQDQLYHYLQHPDSATAMPAAY
ncbi:putative histonearginine methyltransferase [Tribonema minus]|uniref:type I protein arginine methyltransferase n=1 Tax=Tribonema minus TaxID=303371 RepID=A0A835YWV6_9STRA|nr:putative histonearginine methyltransferase [Tribonema minus]